MVLGHKSVFHISSQNILDCALCLRIDRLSNVIILGCQFRWKAASNYVKAIERPQSKGDKTIDDVQLNYNSIKSILSLANVSYWNMTWVEIPNPPFAKSSDKIEVGRFSSKLCSSVFTE